MGVYIPNLEIPTSCFDCPIAHPALGNLGAAILGCPLIGKTLSAPFCEEKRMDNCPLVPVPPHGDLIDRDATIGKIGHLADEIDKKLGYEKSASYIMMTLYLNNADEFPTIIPAEEGE